MLILIALVKVMYDSCSLMCRTRLRPYVFHVTFLLLFGVLNIHIQVSKHKSVEGTRPTRLCT